MKNIAIYLMTTLLLALPCHSQAAVIEASAESTEVLRQNINTVRAPESHTTALFVLGAFVLLFQLRPRGAGKF